MLSIVFNNKILFGICSAVRVPNDMDELRGMELKLKLFWFR